VAAAGELWEKSGLGEGEPGDAYVWGLTKVPSTHGRVVQISAGTYGLIVQLASHLVADLDIVSCFVCDRQPITYGATCAS
jgi:hypothetical protein